MSGFLSCTAKLLVGAGVVPAAALVDGLLEAAGLAGGAASLLVPAAFLLDLEAWFGFFECLAGSR